MSQLRERWLSCSEKDVSNKLASSPVANATATLWLGIEKEREREREKEREGTISGGKV